jgi:hypothetical protein
MDQSDIRGSKPHNLDPSGAASDCYRDFGWVDFVQIIQRRRFLGYLSKAYLRDPDQADVSRLERHPADVDLSAAGTYEAGDEPATGPLRRFTRTHQMDFSYSLLPAVLLPSRANERAKPRWSMPVPGAQGVSQVWVHNQLPALSRPCSLAGPDGPAFRRLGPVQS